MLKIEHKCSRCSKAVSTEVQDVKAAVAAEDVEKARARTLAELQEYVGTLDPELIPDLFVLRRGFEPVVQSFLCNEDDAKRSCFARVTVLVEECMTFDPRKPKTKKEKAPEASPPATPAPEPAKSAPSGKA